MWCIYFCTFIVWNILGKKTKKKTIFFFLKMLCRFPHGQAVAKKVTRKFKLLAYSHFPSPFPFDPSSPTPNVKILVQQKRCKLILFFCVAWYLRLLLNDHANPSINFLHAFKSFSPSFLIFIFYFLFFFVEHTRIVSKSHTTEQIFTWKFFFSFLLTPFINIPAALLL